MSEFNSTKKNIKDVKAYLKKHPDQLQAVLDAEKARTNPRMSFVAELEAQAAAVLTNAEPTAVTVAPADQSEPNKASTQRKNKIFGKEYEVSPDRGHRVSR